jgi:cytochrome c oxidase cbb3-type subunit 4
MHLYSILASITTVISFLVFLSIVAWAWSARREQAFAEAARAPFALPDED